MENPVTSALGSPSVVKAMACSSALEVLSMMNSLPAAWFEPSQEALRGFCRLVSATTGQSQAEVIRCVRLRGPALLELANVPDHLFLAHCVGRKGNAQGVQELFLRWRSVIRSPELLSTSSSTLTSSALLHGNVLAWQEGVVQDPAQLHRPNRLRLACSRACSEDHLEWAMGLAEGLPWEERVHGSWLVLSRLLEVPPQAFLVESPELGVSVVRQLCAPLPWRQSSVIAAVEAVVNHPSSPFLALMSHEYALPPLSRLRGLAACQEFAEYLEGQGVCLRVGSAKLAQALHQQQSRLSGVRDLPALR